jgi:hypothetical protein
MPEHAAIGKARTRLVLALLTVYLAYTAFVWLLATSPVQLAATYAYVNQVVAVALGWGPFSANGSTPTPSSAPLSSSPASPPPSETRTRHDVLFVEPVCRQRRGVGGCAVVAARAVDEGLLADDGRQGPVDVIA